MGAAVGNVGQQPLQLQQQGAVGGGDRARRQLDQAAQQTLERAVGLGQPARFCRFGRGLEPTPALGEQCGLGAQQVLRQASRMPAQGEVPIREQQLGTLARGVALAPPLLQGNVLHDAQRRVNERVAEQLDVAGVAAAFVLDRLAHALHHQALAFADEFADRAPLGAAGGGARVLGDQPARLL